MVKLGLETAEEVARTIWPARNIKLPGESTYILADGLRNQAAQAGKALKA